MHLKISCHETIGFIWLNSVAAVHSWWWLDWFCANLQILPGDVMSIQDEVNSYLQKWLTGTKLQMLWNETFANLEFCTDNFSRCADKRFCWQTSSFRNAHTIKHGRMSGLFVLSDLLLPSSFFQMSRPSRQQQRLGIPANPLHILILISSHYWIKDSNAILRTKVYY